MPTFFSEKQTKALNSNFLTFSLLPFFTWLLLTTAFYQNAYAQCTGCTQTVTTNTTINFTANNQTICLHPATALTFNASVNFYSFTGVTLCIGPNVTWNGGSFTVWSPTFSIVNYGTISQSLPTIGTGMSFQNKAGGVYTGSMTLNGGDITNDGTFNPSAYAHNNGTLTLNSSGSATMPSFSVSNGSVVNNGNLIINGGFTVNGTGSATLGGIVSITGAVENNKTLTVSGNLSIGGNLTTNSGASTSLTGATSVGGSLTNNGTITAGQLTVMGSLTNNGGSMATLNGPTTIGQDVTNNGTVHLNGPLNVNGNLTNNGSGTIDGSGSLSGCSSICPNGTITNYGTFTGVSVCKSVTGNNSNAAAGGTLTSPAAVCGGTSSGTLTLSGHNGSIVRWEMSANSSFSSPTNITNTTTTLSYSRTVTTYYRAVVSGGSCGVQYSTVATVAVNGTPTITSQPASTNVCSGAGTATFSVAATGSTAYSYQWEYSTNGAAPWLLISNLGVYSGATTNVLSITNATGINNYRYRAKVTSCGTTVTTNGSATLTLITPATAYNVGGGGAYCSGGTGVSVTLSDSQNGYSYELYLNNVATGQTRTGTNNALTWGNQTTAGTYTIVAFSGNCNRTMTGSATVSIDTPPTIYNITSTGTNCTGNNTTYGLSNSEVGVSYQLRRTGSNVGAAVAGTGNAISFAAQNTAGTYTVIATRGTCTSTMNGSFILATLPTAYSVGGGGAYCSGGTGVSVTLSDSQNGYSYELYLNNVATGQTRTGTNNALTWGNQTTAGTYTIIASNGNCSISMNGSTAVSISPLSVGGNIAGSISVCSASNSGTLTLSGHTGSVVRWESSTSSTFASGVTPITNTTTSLAYSNLTTTTYYRAVIQSSPCSAANSPIATVTVNASPTLYTVTGGGSYCSGGSGLPVGLSGSQTGVTYQLMRGATNVVSVSGTGNALNFGNQTVAGTYSVVATNTTTSCSRTMTGSVAINANTIPVITSSPSNQSACAGTTASVSFTVGATTPAGTLSYQWQVLNGTVWTDLSSTSPYSGVTSATITITSPNTALNTKQYRAVVSTSGCTSVTSNPAFLAVSSPPVITSQPNASTVCVGSNATFTILVTGSTPLTYQWQVSSSSTGPWTNVTNGSSYSGVSTATLTVLNTPTSLSGRYYQVLINGCSSATSSAAQLTVNTSPTISAQPGNRSICSGATTTFSVTAAAPSGGTLSYQWQESQDNGVTWSTLSNASLYSNVTTATMTITGAGINLSGRRYRVALTSNNSVCSLYSDGTATLTINSLVSSPLTASVCTGSPLGYTITSGSPTATFRWSRAAVTGISNTAVSNVNSSTINETLVNTTSSPIDVTYALTVTVTGNTCSPTTANLIVTVMPSITIKTLAISPTTLCVGSTINVGFVAPCGFNSGNTFTAQLSDATGSFSTPINIGTISGTTSGTIPATIPSGTVTAGTMYRIRVVSSSPVITGSNNGNDLTLQMYSITPLMSQSITANESGTTLTATSAGVSSYQWGYYTELGGSITNLPSTASTYQPNGADFPNPGTYYIVCTMTTASAGCAQAISNAVTVYVNCPMTANLIYNGDFSVTPDSPVGSTTSTVTPPTNLGFTSQYFYANTSGSLSNNADGQGTTGGEGKYGIGANPNFFHTAFCNVGTNFQPSPESGGNMLIGNAATSGSQNLWQQTITVKPNTDYVLTFWAASMAGAANSLQFGIYAGCFRTGADISVAQVGVNNCSWTKFTVQLSSGTMTSVDLAIRNISAAAGGNDIAIDDITFYECQPSNGYFSSADSFIWRGFSTNWFDMDNWGTACVLPACSDDIIIPVLTSDKFYPVIDASGASAGTVTINNGATLKINSGFNLDVCGNFINNNGTLTAGSSSTMTFIGARNPQIISGNLTGANQLGNLTINKTNNADVMRLGTHTDIAGNLTITRGNLDANGRNLNLTGALNTATTGTFTSSANTTNVTGNLSNSGAFVAGSGTLNVTGIFTNAGTFIATSNVTRVSGAVTNSGTYTAGSGTLRAGNNLTNSGTFNANTGTVEFNGTANQAFSQTGTGTFYNLVINNAAASSQITFNPAATTVSNQLTLTRGLAVTTGTNEIRVTNSAASSVSGHSASSYVFGILRRSVTGLATYDFPVGDATRYELARLQITSNLGVATIAGTFKSATASNGSGLTNLDGQGNTLTICSGGYWDLTPNTAALSTARYNLTLFPIGFSCAGIDQTFIKRTNASATWTYDGSNYVDATTRSGIRSFSEYAFASSNVSLPVQLVRFEGKLKEEKVELNWLTAKEKDNAYFEIERSSNAIHFQPIGRVKGSGNSKENLSYEFKDEHPLPGTSYYRLKQVDWDGIFEYSKTIAIEKALAHSFIELYPNPLGKSHTATLRIRSASQQNYMVQIQDTRGREMANFPLPVNIGDNEFNFNAHQTLAAGIYIIQLTPQGAVNGQGSWQFKLVVQ